MQAREPASRPSASTMPQLPTRSIETLRAPGMEPLAKMWSERQSMKMARSFSKRSRAWQSAQPVNGVTDGSRDE